MNILYDIHTHHLNAANANIVPVLNVNLSIEGTATPKGLYSASIHPWYADSNWQATISNNIDAISNATFIGECGFDRLRSTLSISEQTALFEAMASIAEQQHKPLIIHCVKAFDILLAEHKKLKPTAAWIIHGFRGKPQLALQLTSAGIYLSFGIKHNEASIKSCPISKLFLETDEYEQGIENVYSLASQSLCIPLEELAEKIASNFLSVRK